MLHPSGPCVRSVVRLPEGGKRGPAVERIGTPKAVDDAVSRRSLRGSDRLSFVLSLVYA